MLNPMRDKNKGMYREGRRGDTCDHGLSRSSLGVKPPPRGRLESKSDVKKKKKKKKDKNILEIKSGVFHPRIY